ncbi:MAG: DNA polymerase III subunit alpha, partial [Deltaproteobacteria bacterium]
MCYFIHLNVHSHYSKGWGIPAIEELCQKAKALGMKKLALTDTNGLYGLIFFIQEARDTGIEPIVGSELAAGSHRALVLVKDRHGYANLCRIISALHCDQDFDLIQSIRDYRSGLIVISDDFRLLKALKRDGIDDLFVELSPRYQMARCYAFSRKTGIPPVATNRVYLGRRGQFCLHRILRAVALNTKLSSLGPNDTCQRHNYLASP